MQKFDTNTDDDTDGMCATDILPRVKRNYNICHNHRRKYRRNVCRWYFTKSWKNITTFPTITDDHTDGICPINILPRVAKKLQPMPQSLTCFLTEAPMYNANSNTCDCQTARSVGTFTDGSGKSNVRVLWHLFTEGCADGLRKIWRDFQNFSAKFKKYRQKLPTEFNATAQENIILCSVGNYVSNIAV